MTSADRVPFKSPWVDSVPGKWGQVKLGHIARIYAGGTPDKKNEAYWVGGTIPWINSGSVNQGLITEPSEYITEVGYQNSSARFVPSGALVMALAGQGRTKGMVAQMGIEATCNQSMAAIVLDDDHPRYMMYWLTANYRNIRGIASDDLRDGLNLQHVSNIPCPRPSLDEQLAIASYLDAETARIDGLIEEKQRLLALLNEQKRTVAESVIAPAPSGREAKLGFFVDLLPGYAFPSEGFSQKQTDVPLLRGVNVAPGSVRWEEVVYWPSDRTSGLERFRLDLGDVVFGMDRPWISSGTRVAMIDQASVGTLLLQRVCRIRGDEAMSNKFVYYALSSDKFRQSIEFELSGISVPHISPEQITRFRVPLLSIQEQNARCSAADAELEEVNRLIALTNEMVLSLQELRSATITDAVLGRIDVREYMKH